jgi:hypothetical protein
MILILSKFLMQCYKKKHESTMRIYYKYKPATGEILAPKPKDFSTNTRPWAKVLSNRMCCALSFNKLKSRTYLANHYTSISIKCKINNYI